MGWVIDLIMYSLEGGFKASDLFVVPILLFGPPLALLDGRFADSTSKIVPYDEPIASTEVRRHHRRARTCP
jgi:hypothetical protein